MNDYAFNLFLASIVFVLSVFTKYLLPYAKTKLESTKLAQVTTWVQTFVRHAEQCLSGSLVKKDYVVKQLKALLVQKNLSMTDEQVEALIESTVNTLFPKEGTTNE